MNHNILKSINREEIRNDILSNIKVVILITNNFFKYIYITEEKNEKMIYHNLLFTKTPQCNRIFIHFILTYLEDYDNGLIIYNDDNDELKILFFNIIFNYVQEHKKINFYDIHNQNNINYNDVYNTFSDIFYGKHSISENEYIFKNKINELIDKSKDIIDKMSLDKIKTIFNINRDLIQINIYPLSSNMNNINTLETFLE